jgi:hypothetical protein
MGIDREPAGGRFEVFLTELFASPVIQPEENRLIVHLVNTTMATMQTVTGTT